MRTNNNNLVDFSSKQTYVASESLLQEAKDKNSDILDFDCYPGQYYTEMKFDIIMEAAQQYVNYNGLEQ